MLDEFARPPAGRVSSHRESVRDDVSSILENSRAVAEETTKVSRFDQALRIGSELLITSHARPSRVEIVRTRSVGSVARCKYEAVERPSTVTVWRLFHPDNTSDTVAISNLLDPDRWTFVRRLHCALKVERRERRKMLDPRKPSVISVTDGPTR